MDIYKGIKSNRLIVSVLRWGFTWGIALLPTLLSTLRYYIDNNKFDSESDLGALTFLGIVMVSEPFLGLILSRNSQHFITKFIVSILCLIVLMLSIWTFSYTNGSIKQNVETYKDKQEEFEKRLDDLNNMVPINAPEIQSVMDEKSQYAFDYDRTIRLNWLSRLCLALCFTVGLGTVTFNNKVSVETET